MVMGTFLFVLLLALLILFFLRQLWSRRHLPPGPLALPLIGTLWADGFWLREDYFRKPAKRYGNIYSIWIGHHLLVVLSGFKAVKEGMTSFPQEFSDRPDDAFLTAIGKGLGIIFSSGHTWKQQRHIVITSLRKLGLGKKSIEHQIEDAAQKLVETFRQTKGQPFDPSFPIRHAISNVICSLSFGHQFVPEDENFQKLIEALEIIVKVTGSFFHLLAKSLNLLSVQLHLEQVLTSTLKIIAIFIFHFKHQSRNDSTYNENNLAQCIFDFFSAGVDTTFATMMWALLLLTNHPDIQEKVQKEIEDVFSISGSISYQDRKKLPYTNAVIHEMQRIKYALLIGAPRKSTKDVKMRGYHIPKETFIIPDVRSVLLDPEQWEKPEEFNPNHFLDKDGKFIEREEFLPFGIGQRSCVGEQLARIETFIFLTSLLQVFRLQLPEGVKQINQSPIVKLTVHPQPYKLCAVPTQA
ncbi:cytochrome P450 2J2-like [Protobothrops mucrosquamatus]|uniref:cytochrome P450 2J2-like n=1 Tax=Protobothrops mucrosquamatus TaxID=103944 RepID=UPI0010FB71E9|nr:cytochrome P450 2J2-like [Protobothrops mucrosquamatus]